MKDTEEKMLQWHSAFHAAIQIELMEDLEFLQFFKEYNLTQKPLQIDTLIIKQRKHMVKPSAPESSDQRRHRTISICLQGPGEKPALHRGHGLDRPCQPKAIRGGLGNV